MRYALPETRYDMREKVTAFHDSLLERVRRLPGVRAAGLVSDPPGGGWGSDYTFSIPDRPSASFQLQDDALYRTSDPGYFTAMQIPLVRGRVFTDQERLTRDHYIVISKKFADQFFPGDNPIGRYISVAAWTAKSEPYEIIGVVGDTVWDVTEPIKATMYFPILSGIPDQTSEATIVVHTTGDPLALSLPIQQQIGALDPSLPGYDIFTIEQLVGRTTASQAFSATLVLAFAALSLLLAAIGLYGVLSYLVTPTRSRDRHPRRTGRAAEPRAATGARRRIASRRHRIAYRSSWRRDDRRADPLRSLRNQPARSCGLRSHGRLSSAHRCCIVRLTRHSGSQNGPDARAAERVTFRQVRSPRVAENEMAVVGRAANYSGPS